MTGMQNRRAFVIGGTCFVVGLAVGGIIFEETAEGHHFTHVQAGAAKQAALRSAGSGKVTEVEPETRGGVAYVVEVTKPGGRRVDVLLDMAYKTLSVQPADKKDYDHDATFWRED